MLSETKTASASITTPVSMAKFLGKNDECRTKSWRQKSAPLNCLLTYGNAVYNDDKSGTRPAGSLANSAVTWKTCNKKLPEKTDQKIIRGPWSFTR